MMLLPFGAVPDEVQYLHTDLQGNVVAVSDESGAIVERYTYEPYGLPSNPALDGPGFTGHVHDADTGLVYMQQRYYDPQIGRFLSVDPVPVRDRADNFNRYWYANNNPYRYQDPDGRNTVAGALLGTGLMLVTGAIILYDEIVNDAAEPDAGGDVPTGDEITFNDKIKVQLGGRGWTEGEVRDLTKTESTGTSVDNTGGKNDPATVYGSPTEGHVVVNDKSGEVVQVSNKNNPDWKVDDRIKWKDNP